MDDLSEATARLLTHLFEPDEQKKYLTPAQQQRLAIYEDLYTRWNDKVYLTDAEMVHYAMDTYKCSRRQAYTYIADTKLALGTQRSVSRTWYRHIVVEMLLKAYQAALQANNIRAMIAAAEGIGKYTNLDKADSEAIDWNKIQPPAFEPSADPKLLGITQEAIENFDNLRKKLERKYKINLTPPPTTITTTQNTDTITDLEIDTEE